MQLSYLLQKTKTKKEFLAINLHSEGKYAEELAVKFGGTKYGWSDRLLYNQKRLQRYALSFNERKFCV